MRRTIILAALAALVLAGGAHAKDKPLPPVTSGSTFVADTGGTVICGGEGCGSGSGGGCGTAGVWRPDGAYGLAYAWYHWCWDGYGHMWDNYGWGDHNNPCCSPAIEFVGYDYDYDLGNGHRTKAAFAYRAWSPWAGWVTVIRRTAEAGVCVDGYGGWWPC